MPSSRAAEPPFDSLIASSGRLRILAALAAGERMEFVELRRCTRLTDGNLCTHARRLESAGFVAIEKEFRDRKPVTHVRLTALGREALERHARELLAALGIGQDPQVKRSRVAQMVQPDESDASAEDDWID
jgi:DNA-binding MarR family transcriptional regulator